MRTRVTVGRYEVIPLLDGIEDMDEGGMVDAFASPSNEAWSPYRSLYPALFSTGGSWRLPVRCFLIRDESHTIVVDTGVGPSTSPAMQWFPAPGRLMEELVSNGIDPSDVGSVVLTHVHDDHIGGTCAADGTPAFPNARYLIHRADIDWQREAATGDDESRTIWDLLLAPLEAAGRLVPIDDAFEVASEVRTRHLPGHTPGHQGVELDAGDASLLLTADTFNHPAQLDRPDWAGSSDNDPRMANELRHTLLKELVDTGRVIAPSHFAEPFGRVATDGDRVVWRPE